MTSSAPRRDRAALHALGVVLALLALLAVELGAAPAQASSTIGTTPDERAAGARATLARGAGITVRGPAEVQSGADVVLSGRVVTRRGTVRRPRPVQVAERLAGRWVVVGRSRSRRNGAFRLAVPAGDAPATRVLRAQAPRAHRLRAARSASLTVEVVDGSEDWSFLMDGGSRWNPCEPISWSYNPVGQAYDALADVTAAVDRIAAASGLELDYVGASSLVYLGDEGLLVGGADLTVGWASAAQLGALVDSVVGVGGAIGRSVTGRDVRWQLTRGWVTLDRSDPLDPAPGFGPSSYGQVLMHEMLHALGLGHAEEPQQLMYPVAGPQNTSFGAGDLAGIARIGAAAGCL